MYFFRLVVEKFLTKETNEPFIFREELPFYFIRGRGGIPTHAAILHALNDFKSFPLKHLGTLPCTGIYLIVSPKFIPKLLSGYSGAT